MVGFQNKNLNSLFMYTELMPISLTSFMLTYNTDKQQYGFSVSNTSGIDLAFFVGNFDFTANYTLMIDYNNDYPYFKYQIIGEEYLYLFYISSNNYPQIMICFIWVIEIYIILEEMVSEPIYCFRLTIIAKKILKF